MTQTPNATLFLQEEFNRRRKRNPQYSLRAFAAALEIPSGRLSEIFSGKRRISKKLGVKIADNLQLNPQDRQAFFNSLHGLHAYDFVSDQEFQALSMDQFHAIADWQHYAILSLFKTANFSSQPKWIAQRLGISVVEARTAMERLLRLGLIARTVSGLERTGAKLTTTHDISCSALRNSHKQNLQQALAALEEIPVELRDITSITMPIDLKKLPEAKKRILKFRRDLAGWLESGDLEEVYNLNIQLVPVSKTKGRRKS